MEKKKINNIQDLLYSDFEKIYETGFPFFEQRTQSQQEYAFSCPNYHLTAYVENEILVGFIAHWEFPTYYYIEHFAIDKTLRGKGLGQLILKEFINSTPKIVLLEIDIITDDISKARLRFYQHNGFFQNTYSHTHPPYQKEYQAHLLIVLTTPRAITMEEYDRFNENLDHIVMKKV